MKNHLLLPALLVAGIWYGCEKRGDITPHHLEYSFQNDTEGWTGDFADYPDREDAEESYALVFEHSTLPPPLNTDTGALKQSGKNLSDDLFMFIKKKVDGLQPGTKYYVSFEIEIASNAASGLFGVGGAPGESVYIKAGASTHEPMKVLDESDNYFRMNIDKGNQSQGGADMKVIGDFANGTDESVYTLKQLDSDSPIEVRSNESGELWLIIGTDSGFESTTTIYYNRINVTVA